MNIKREEFLNDLEQVKSGLSPREFVEQSSCLCFIDGDVVTFNDEVSCRKKVGLDITGAVQADRLFDILGKLEDEVLTVTENEKGELEFRGKRKSFGVTKEAEIFLPIDHVERPEKWRPLPKEFTEAVGMVMHCTSTDESKFVLTCVHIAPEHIEACNQFQMLRVALKTGVSDSVLVRGTALRDLTQLAMDKVCLTKNWIHFKNGSGLVYSCRRYSEVYPSLDKLLKMKGHPIVLPKGLGKASERAAVFAVDPAGEPYVTVSLVSGKVRVKGEGVSGWYKEVSKVSYDGPPIEFLISPELLTHITANYAEATISKDRLEVTGGHWRYVAALSAPKTVEEESEEEKEEE